LRTKVDIFPRLSLPQAKMTVIGTVIAGRYFRGRSNLRRECAAFPPQFLGIDPLKSVAGRNKSAKTIMEAKIITAIGRRDEAFEVIPCLENLTRPGMTVVILVPYPLEFWPYIRGHWVTTESVRAATELGREIITGYSWESQQELAERKFAAVREALGMKGVEVEVNFYTGSLKEALLKYSADPKVFWIVRPASTGRLFGRLLGRIVAPFRSTTLAPSWSLFQIAHRRGAYRRTG
jgi:hypothetical protein